MKYEKRKPRILVSSGEPAGIGPDLIIQLAQIAHHNDLTIIGDPDLLLERAKQLIAPFGHYHSINNSVPIFPKIR